MAAGLSLEEKNVDLFRKTINTNCQLTEEDFEEKVQIDVPMPMDYVTVPFVEELDLLEPFGNGNPKPLFAQKEVRFLKGRILGQNRNVGKYVVADEQGKNFDVVYFGDLDQFHAYLTQKFGQESVSELYQGMAKDIVLSIAYYPDINEYRGIVSLQMILKFYQ